MRKPEAVARNIRHVSHSIPRVTERDFEYVITLYGRTRFLQIPGNAEVMIEPDDLGPIHAHKQGNPSGWLVFLGSGGKRYGLPLSELEKLASAGNLKLEKRLLDYPEISKGYIEHPKHKPIIPGVPLEGGPSARSLSRLCQSVSRDQLASDRAFFTTKSAPRTVKRTKARKKRK